MENVKDIVLDYVKKEYLEAVSYTHLRAHETVLDLVCRLLLEKKKTNIQNNTTYLQIYNIILKATYKKQILTNNIFTKP